MPKQMALDEKTRWNPTWTTIDNVVSRVLGAFFHAHLFEVKAHYNDHYGLSQSMSSWVQVIILYETQIHYDNYKK
jgi:hypothetical protein